MDTVDYLLDESSPKSVQPAGITLDLKPHQLTSLYRMCMLDRDCGMTMKAAGIKVRSNIAILADLAGYGKTITFLAMVEVLKAKDTQWMPQARTFITEGYGIALTRARDREYTNTTLIVVPDNLVDHWQRHLDQYTDLSYETVETGIYTKIIIEDYDLILCPARHYNQFIRENSEYNWNRVAFDEADSINIPRTEYVNARFLWLITNTYDNIPKRKNTGFLKNLFKTKSMWDNPIKSYFFPVVVKGTDQFVKKSFALLEPKVMYIECLTPNFIRAIRNCVTPYVLELINAGDLDGAITLLGGNVDSDRNIMELVTRGIKNEIVSARARLETLERLEISNTERTEKRDKLVKKIESLEGRQEQLKKAISDAVCSDCMICYDLLKHPTITPCCNNMFCAECLLGWMKSAGSVCPMCRSNFDPTGLHTISTETCQRCTTSQKSTPKQNKMNALLDIIKQNPQGQYIIFSGHSETFREVGQALGYAGIQYGTLTTALHTESVLGRFRRGHLPVILLDAEHNGAGIEIPQASDVILYHQMRTSLETQAIARAQRPGRVGQLRVWKLKYQHEYTDVNPPGIPVNPYTFEH